MSDGGSDYSPAASGSLQSTPRGSFVDSAHATSSVGDEASYYGSDTVYEEDVNAGDVSVNEVSEVGEVCGGEREEGRCGGHGVGAELGGLVTTNNNISIFSSCPVRYSKFKVTNKISCMFGFLFQILRERPVRQTHLSSNKIKYII